MRRQRLFVPLIALAASLVPGPAMTASAAPPVTSISLPNGFAPEDMALGGGTTFYVASFAGHAGVFVGDLHTGTGRILLPGLPGRTDVGVFVDQSNRLWVTGGAGGDVRVYDATTGEPLGSYLLNPSGGFVSDVVVRRGVAYLTDSFAKQMYVIAVGTTHELPGPSAFASCR